MIDQILGFISKPLTSWVEGREARKYMKEEGRLTIAKAKVALEVSRYEAEAKRLHEMDVADADYDKQAQMERRHTLADEFLIFCVVLLVGSHFLFPSHLAAGWVAMGYSSVPWWLEFIIVGVFVSVFGLMRLFREFNPFRRKIQKETKEVSK